MSLLRLVEVSTVNGKTTLQASRQSGVNRGRPAMPLRLHVRPILTYQLCKRSGRSVSQTG